MIREHQHVTHLTCSASIPSAAGCRLAWCARGRNGGRREGYDAWLWAYLLEA
jgi:hypothetical protein